jgi:hypothetical protein
MTETPAEKPTSTLVVANPFVAADLRSISTYEDAVRLLQDNGINLRDAATEIGDGFLILENKDELIDKQFVILHATFGVGDYQRNQDGTPAEFCIMRVVSAAGKFIVTDGGTGINRQLREYIQETGTATGLVCSRGLRKSTYDTDASGQPTKDPALMTGKGTTYYLNV